MVLRLLAIALVAALAALGGRELTAADEATESAAQLRGRVIRVVDGDTLKVRVGARRETVRLIGVDTPESVRPGTPVECGARAASRHLQRLALTPDGRGRSVTLITDPTQDRRDRYDRLLAYAETPGGRDLGEAQVRAGRARVYVYGDAEFRRVGAYRAAEREAREAGRGLWAACDGDGHRPAS